ncbi:MAG: hypothetical protein CMJ81_10485 [Planctomycetaceae bacterium]|nr:hypothetical protein [Planctomycetaceae bacterium]
MSTVNIFPTTVFHKQMGLDAPARKRMSQTILDMQQASQARTKAHNTWTGDIYGASDLHLHDDFEPLVAGLREAVIGYFSTIGFDSSDLQMHITRCWGTVGLANQSIKPHQHLNSHVSIAYYPDDSCQDTNLTFHNRHPQPSNITVPGMYMPLNLQKRVQPNPLLSKEIQLPVAEDMAVVFPSNVTHSVHPNRSSRPRISIATDTFFTLRKDVDDEEFFLPPLDKWRAV